MSLELIATAINAQTCRQIVMQECENSRRKTVDWASAALAVATFLIFDRYYDKYEEVVEWRDEIGTTIKDYLKTDIDHFQGVVMPHMASVVGEIMSSPKVTVHYQEILNRFDGYSGEMVAAAKGLIAEMGRKTGDKMVCQCNPAQSDLPGWAVAAAVSAADGRVRFDEVRVPRRLDMLASALHSAHSATFHLPSYDYQALSNAANLASTLASVYASVANSALGSFGYYSANFMNSLEGAS